MAISLPANRVLLLLAVVSAALAAWLLWPAKKHSPEQVIVREVNRMVDAAEKRDVGGVVEYVSERFRTTDGSMDRQQLKGFLAAQMLRGEWVRVWAVKLEPTVTSPTTANLVGTFVFGRANAASVKELPQASVFGQYEITGALELEQDGIWRFVSASYRPVDATQLY